MKREIEFRAQRLNDGVFVYGLLHFNAAESCLQITEFIQTSPTMSDPCGDQFNLWHNINPETVGEFTGLLDKNGKKIFEGDVLKLQYPINYGFGGIHDKELIVTISYDNGAFWFIGEGYTDCNWHFYDKYEVIGNIYENESLLK